MKYGVMSYLYVNGRVLMINKHEREDDPNSGLYTLPGGKLENWERGINPRGRLEAALRETEGETGLALADPVWRGVILFDNSERIFDNWPNPDDFLVYVFSATIYSGVLRDETEEGVPVWIQEDDIPKIPKNVGDKKIYEWLRDSRYFMGVIKHKGKELNEEGTFVDYFG